MSTVDDKNFVDNIIKNHGYYNGDNDNSLGDNPRCIKIVAYDNAWGGIGYGLIFENENPDKYRASDYVRNPRTIWIA